MKWVITGGAGFIGCHAAAKFHQHGDHVVVVDNLSRRGADVNLAWLRSLGVNAFIKADVRDPRQMDALMAEHGDADAVLHLAGQVAVTSSLADPRADFEANALGTFNVLEAVRNIANGKPAVLYSSTVARGTSRSRRRHCRAAVGWEPRSASASAAEKTQTRAP